MTAKWPPAARQAMRSGARSARVRAVARLRTVLMEPPFVDNDELGPGALAKCGNPHTLLGPLLRVRATLASAITSRRAATTCSIAPSLSSGKKAAPAAPRHLSQTGNSPSRWPKRSR